MLVGYARVSTGEQTFDLQVGALWGAGCEFLYKEHVTAARAERPELMKALERVREGDTLVVWRLDRLGRSLPNLIGIVAGLHKRGVGFRSISDDLDTTPDGGESILHVFGVLAEFERDVVRERSGAGLAAARARGRLGGRPKKLTNGKLELAQKMYESKYHTGAEICETLKISRATLYRYVTPREHETA